MTELEIANASIDLALAMASRHHATALCKLRAGQLASQCSLVDGVLTHPLYNSKSPDDIVSRFLHSAGVDAAAAPVVS